MRHVLIRLQLERPWKQEFRNHDKDRAISLNTAPLILIHVGVKWRGWNERDGGGSTDILEDRYIRYFLCRRQKNVNKDQKQALWFLSHITDKDWNTYGVEDRSGLVEIEGLVTLTHLRWRVDIWETETEEPFGPNPKLLQWTTQRSDE